ICRFKDYHITKNLFEFEADLDILSGFFIRPWTIPKNGLSAKARVMVLRKAGLDLFSLGDLKEAAISLYAGGTEAAANHDWKNAAILASDHSRVLLTLGELKKASDVAETGLERAVRSDDEIQVFRRRATLGNVLLHLGDEQA